MCVCVFVFMYAYVAESTYVYSGLRCEACVCYMYACVHYYTCCMCDGVVVIDVSDDIICYMVVHTNYVLLLSGDGFSALCI